MSYKSHSSRGSHVGIIGVRELKITKLVYPPRHGVRTKFHCNPLVFSKLLMGKTNTNGHVNISLSFLGKQCGLEIDCNELRNNTGVFL